MKQGLIITYTLFKMLLIYFPLLIFTINLITENGTREIFVYSVRGIEY